METIFRERRRNYYINKKFQRNFIIKFCSLVALGSVISAAVIYEMSKATVTTTFENSRLAIKTTADFILPTVLLSGAVVIVVIGVATIIITLFTSHKIAGPLYRMDKDVQEVAAGNLAKRFNLRQGDEIRPLAESLDRMAERLRVDIAEAKNAFSELESAPDLGPASSAKAKDALRRLKSVIEKFKT